MNTRSMYFQRGQIWWMKRDANEMTPHVMESKDRYYLVVSCETNNRCAPIANVLVISSKKYDGLPMHIPFTMPSGKRSIIECEHIYTKSLYKFKDGEYVGVVSSDVMKAVDIALANQLALSECIPGYDDIVKLVKQLADKKTEQLLDYRLTVTDNMVMSVCKQISDMFDRAISEDQAKELESTKTSTAIDKFNARLAKTAEIQAHNANNKSNSTRNKWSAELKAQFLADVEILDIEEVVKKYNFNSTKSVYSAKYRFMKEAKK